MKRPCIEANCGALTTGTRCPEHERGRDLARGSSTARGYGYRHKALSQAERGEAIGGTCFMCGKPMTEGQALALDHNPERTAYRGVVHLSCNARDGATRSGRR